MMRPSEITLIDCTAAPDGIDVLAVREGAESGPVVLVTVALSASDGELMPYSPFIASSSSSSTMCV